jgi:hypothetical protein
MPPARRGISRFIVMAILQAERARRLGLPTESADSFGLNRAIFYAAAKAGFRSAGAERPTGEPKAPGREPTAYPVGDDVAYRDPNSETLLFAIGGETQTEEAFHQQVAHRFGDHATFERARKEAQALVEAAPEAAVRSAQEFFATVYRPHRDELAVRWSDWLGLAPTGGAARAARSRRETS